MPGEFNAAVSAAGPATREVGSGPVRYLALGDSYTIGTGASSKAHNYPSILSARLATATGSEVGLTNPAVNGFTTQDLIDNELGYVSKLKPQLVSILIGVNDLVQGCTPEQYEGTLVKIYDTVGTLELAAGRVVAISIPNWSVAPAAATFGNPDRIRGSTDTFNGIAQQAAAARGFTWVDITAVSTSGLGSPGWISSDQLHPGDSQYAARAEVIWRQVRGSWVA
jgi:lysophospholipase L1-like esterase